MNYLKKSSIACLGMLGLSLSDAVAQSPASIQTKAAAPVDITTDEEIKKLHIIFQKEANLILRTNQTLYPMAVPLTDKKNALLSKTQAVFNIDFKNARNLPSDYVPSIANMADFKSVLTQAEDKNYISYTNEAGKNMRLRTNDLKELAEYVEKDGTHIYLNLNDNDEAYYLTVTEKINNYFSINQTILSISTGFLEKYDLSICQDVLKHEESHGNGNNLLETPRYFKSTDSAAIQRYFEFRADSITLRARTNAHPFALAPYQQGLVRLFAADNQDLCKEYAEKNKTYQDQKKFIKTNQTLEKRPIKETMSSNLAELTKLEKKYQAQQSFQHDKKANHYTHAQRVYYLIVLGNLFKEEHRNGVDTPLGQTLKKLLPQPYTHNPSPTAYQAPAFKLE